MSDPFKSSGTAGAVTIDNDAVTLIAAVPKRIFEHIMIINNGAEPGFFKIGAGGEPVRIEKAIEAFDGVVIENEEIFIQRVFDGANMTNVFGVIW